MRGWSIFRNREDELHNRDLGWGKDVAGQLIFDFATMYGGPDTEVNLAALREKCRLYLKGRATGFHFVAGHF